MHDQSTVLEDRPRAFPKTRWSIVREASDPSSDGFRNALEQLAQAYWKPAYAHFRRKWGKTNEDAKDLTQEFFATLCEKGFASRIDPGRGLFRSYVIATLDNFARLKYRKERRLKRGGDMRRIPLPEAESSDSCSDRAPDAEFQRDWAWSVLEAALREMEEDYRKAGRERIFQLFVQRDVDPPDGDDVGYEALGKRFDMPISDVTNLLYRARKELRERVLNRVRDTVTTEEEAEAEMKTLFAGNES